MPRSARLFVPGVPVYAQQSARVTASGEPAIFVDNSAEKFRQILLTEAQKRRVLVYAYCILPLGYRLLVSASESKQLSQYLQALGKAATLIARRQGQTANPLWIDRTQTCLIESKHFLLSTSLQIDLLPLRERLVDQPEFFRFSSFRAHIGLEVESGITDHAEYWALGNTPFERQQRYRQLSGEPLAEDFVRTLTRYASRGWVLGRADLIDGLSDIIGDRRSSPSRRGRPRKLICAATNIGS